MRLPIRSLSYAALAALAVAAPATEAQPPEGADPRAALTVKPDDIEVGMFYRGAKVHVEGLAPPGHHLALTCLGAEKKVELKRKGKVGQVLWMNVGDVSFERVPSLYLTSYEPGVQDSSPSPAPASAYDHVEAQVLPASADASMRLLFREFIKLKEGEQLYSSAPLRREGNPQGATRISADFWLPASAPAGTYEVELVGDRAGASEVLAAEKLVVRRVGLASLISTVAMQHGLLYGLFSVVLAIGAGFLSGVLFAGAKKGH